jgi:tetratricopeptide (TPR) repeat protein
LPSTGSWPPAPTVTAPTLLAASPDRYGLECAYSLTSLGARLSELGRPAEALPAIEEAVSIYRKLAAATPDKYHTNLAFSLTKLSELQTALGRKTDADAAGDETAAVSQQHER